MTVASAAVLLLLGLVGGFVAGLVGLGGAIVTIPLLLYVPPLFRLPALDMKTVAGITMAQVVVASTAGMLIHYRHRAVNTPLALLAGGKIGRAHV